MYGFLFLIFLVFFTLSYFVWIPVFNYFRDPKGLRKYPNLCTFSGITDLAFLWEGRKGFRSKAQLVAHQKSPVVRIGPNSLSYSDLRAIKVRFPTPSTPGSCLTEPFRISMAMVQNAERTLFIAFSLVLITT